jgi:uncharacterized membrane protein YbhN (UPF0104 family)
MAGVFRRVYSGHAVTGRAVSDHERVAVHAVLGDVFLRGVSEGGHGFVSGHAAVAAALATVAAGHVSRRVRWAAWALVWAVAAARVYVGAHLPFDVIGGAAVGWAVGGIIHLARGTPGHVPTSAEVARALAAAGQRVAAVVPLHADARGSIPYRVDAQPPLFVKAVGRDQRDGDLLYKLVRFLAFRETGDEAPFATPKRQLEHEAYLGLLARRAGVRVPEVVLTSDTGDGVWLEAQELLDATPLAALGADRVGDALLDELWGQVARMRAARLAHRDLRLANVLVDRAGRPWLVDWGFAEASAVDHLLDADGAELLAATAAVVGAERAVACAERGLGLEALAGAARLLQPLALSAATRRGLLASPGLLAGVHAALAARGIHPGGREELMRLPLRPGVLAAAGLALWAVHHLITRVAGVRELADVVAAGSWRWLVVAALTAAGGYLAAAVAQMAAAPVHLALGRTAAVQLAGSFVSKMTPPGSGSATVSTCYLRCAGVPADAARRAVQRTRAAGLVVHALGLTAAWAWIARAGVNAGAVPGGWATPAAVTAGLGLLGVLLWRPLRRRPSVGDVFAEVRALTGGLGSHGRSAALFAGAAGVSAARVLALTASLWAFGAEPSLAEAAAVYLSVAALAPLGPLPGGLGIVEAGLVVGLTAVGVPAAPAVAGVLTYRLITFWAPIGPAAVAYRRLRRCGCC